jgi:glycine betaine/choline ABC-type transport system substrate-binding protein
MNRRTVYRAALAATGAATLAVCLPLAACRRADPAAITVGAKNFTEQLILGEILAQAIEGATGSKVHRRLNLGGTMICHTALLRGDIDVYVEYTGTALTAILKQPAVTDPQLAYSTVRDAYAQRFDCVWLPPLGFDNTYAIAVRKDFARKHSLRSVSDLHKLAGEMSAGFTSEFSVREDGYPGLAAAYGFRFRQTRDLDPSLMYQALAKGDVDAICAFATDGRLVAYNLRVLADDKAFFPPYQAAPVARRDLLERHPAAAGVLARLEGLIDEEAMRELNRLVDEEKRDPALVARDFLRGRGLVE